MSNLFTRLYAIPSNANAEAIAVVIDAIRKDYGVPADSDGIAPTSIVGASNVTPPPAAAAGTLELDSDGVPHDERIHSGSKGKNKDGTWKKLKNVDPALHKRITAELQAAQRATGQPAASATPPAPAAATTTPPAPPAAPTPPAPPAPTLSAYQSLLQAVGPYVNNGTLNNDYLNQVAEYFGVSGGWPNMAAASTEVVAKVREYIGGQLQVTL